MNITVPSDEENDSGMVLSTEITVSEDENSN